jgi:hypothetical protein
MNEICECSTDGIEMPSCHLCEETVIHPTPKGGGEGEGESERERERERARERERETEETSYERKCPTQNLNVIISLEHYH